MGQAASALHVSEGHDFGGRVAVITGASSGIGKETARVLLLRGARVVIPVRSIDKGEAVKKELQDEYAAATRDVLAPNCIVMFQVFYFITHPSASSLNTFCSATSRPSSPSNHLPLKCLQPSPRSICWFVAIRTHVGALSVSAAHRHHPRSTMLASSSTNTFPPATGLIPCGSPITCPIFS